MNNPERDVTGLAGKVGGSRLLRAKLRVPSKPDHYVRRERLHQYLGEAVRGPVTLIIAPAGAGKSSLLAGWAAECTAPVCWLTLDETDRDAAQLWWGIIGALETVCPGNDESIWALLCHPDLLFAAIDQLIEDVGGRLQSPTVLVVDDLHLVDDEDLVARSLAYFVQHVPEQLHVVLASRRVPQLPLDRLRAQGRVRELHFAELRFSPREAAEMLTRLAPSMSEQRVSEIAARAGGWAAGLQLAALAARSASASERRDPPNYGADALIHDYVWQEVLAREEPDLVRVLLDTSVVDRLDRSLAQALTGRPDADDLLLRAEARGLFVSRISPEGWFEVHAPVRAGLLAEMRRASPGSVKTQHALAAKWFEAADEVPLSLEHWLLAGEPRQALRLLSARHGDLYDTGREATIRRTIGAIPLETVTADLDAMIDFAWCHLLISRRRFVELVDQMTWWTQRHACDQTQILRATILQSDAATMSGRWVAGGELARLVLTALGESWWRDPFGRFGWNAVARQWALTESWDDSADEVREAVMTLARDASRRLAFEGSRALGQALAGRPLNALRIASGVRGAVAVDRMTILQAELLTAEAVAHREIGDRSRAMVELEGLAEAPAETMLYCRVLAMLELTQAHLDTGDLGAARRLFTAVESIFESEDLGPDARAWLARVGTRLALAHGERDSAGAWSARIADSFWGPLSTGRVKLACGDRAGAQGDFDTAVERCPRHEVVLDLLRAQSVDDRETALKLVADAVERASAHGLIQTVVSEGPGVLDLVERESWRAPRPWMERLRRAAVISAPPEASMPLEPLTDREREVLRYLPSRLTIREIANELYISVNTLKFHLKVIYRKLGVNSRGEAAEAARRIAPPPR